MLALLAALSCAGLRADPEPAAPVSDGRHVMGTVLEITAYGPASAEGLDPLFDVAFHLDALLSVYRSDSDIQRVNARAARSPQAVHTDTADVLRRSLEFQRLTRGTFDVAVGPLVQLWMEAARRNALPDPRQLARARTLVGAEAFRVDREGRVSLRRPGVSLDLGGVGKGYALDRMRPLLREAGIDTALLNFGQSSTWALGAPPGADGWNLLVRGAGESIAGVVTLRDRALSVSGSLGQFVEIEGRRYGHVLDPRTGRPLTRPRQALVVARNATLAEALSKALLILGEAEGIALVDDQPGCEGLLIDADGRAWVTSRFREVTRFEPVP